MIKLIVYGVVMAAAYCGACYASDLWMGKSGFWWGVAAAVLFDFCISLISGASKNAWDSLVKEASSASIGGKLFNMLCAGVSAYVGYHILLVGWFHWWTGFWASMLLGLPGLCMGGIVLFVAVVQALLAIIPRKFWVKLVK